MCYIPPCWRALPVVAPQNEFIVFSIPHEPGDYTILSAGSEWEMVDSGIGLSQEHTCRTATLFRLQKKIKSPQDKRRSEGGRCVFLRRVSTESLSIQLTVVGSALLGRGFLGGGFGALNLGNPVEVGRRGLLRANSNLALCVWTMQF